MLLRLRPLINAGLRSLGRNVDARTSAIEVSVLSPEERAPASKAVFLPSQLEKISAVVPGIESIEKEIAFARSSEEVHAPLIRYTVENCLVHEAGFDSPGGIARKKQLASLRFLVELTRPLEEAVFCMSDPSHTYFAHWLRDGCALAMLARPGEAALLDVRKDWPHTTQYLAALGLSPTAPGQYAVRRLTFFQDFGLNASKRERWAEMRRRLQHAVPDQPTGGSSVYFRRGNTGAQRAVANEEEVANALCQRGFEIFDIAGASMEALQQRFRTARIVVSMEGSHLCHLHLSMPAGSCIVALIPSDRFTMVQLGYARAVAMRFAFMVVTPTEGGYSVDIPTLLKTIDLVA